MLWSGSETPERQRESRLKHQQAQILVSVRFEKTETPARFEPMPSKKHADRMLHVTFGTHKKQSSKTRRPQIRKDRNTSRIKARRTRFLHQKGCRTSTFETHIEPQAGARIPNDGCSKSRQRQIRKDRNTSKIRAHAKQKTRRQNASRHLWNP